MRRITRRTFRKLFFVSLVLLSLATAISAAPVTRQAQGANAAAILATVNLFRGDLGGVNNGDGGLYPTGRREINWDDVPDFAAAPGALPVGFFQNRGIIVSTPCNPEDIFIVSADSSNPSGAPVRYGHLDPSYPSTFTTFSAERLFSTGGDCNITEVKFVVPGTNIRSSVRGFGVVFTDVDSSTSTKIKVYDETGISFGLDLNAGVANNGLSFVGVSFNAGERIGSVHIISGKTSLGAGVVDGVNGAELVVMDDFIYGEPRASEFHPGDVDGDGVTDSRIFRPSNATWYTLNSGTNTVSIAGFGANGDLPVDGDFDGDSRADLCIFRPSNGQWWFMRSSNGTVYAAAFGQNGDRPVPGDYDKDGKTDIALWRPSNGNYYVLRSNNNFTTFYSYPFGQNGDVPVF